MNTKIDLKKHWLVSIVTVVICWIAFFLLGKENGYKNGQIDALKGKQHYKIGINKTIYYHEAEPGYVNQSEKTDTIYERK